MKMSAIGPLSRSTRKVVFMEEVDDRKHVVMLENGQQKRLTSGDDWHLYPDITTSGDRVTLVSGPDDSHLAVSVMDLDSGRETFLTTAEGRNLHPDFSGDGRKIAFSEAAGPELRHITVMDVPSLDSVEFEPPGSEPERKVVPGSEEGYFPSLSQTGNTVLYQRARNGTREIVRYDFTTGMERVVAEGMAPSLAPDDSSFAYTKKVDGEWNIRVKDLSTGVDRQVTHTPHFDFAPSFSPDGSLYFASNRRGTFDIYHLDAEEVKTGKGEAEVVVQGPETFYAPEASG